MPRKKNVKNARTAATSDRHELYQVSVQEPETEISFLEMAFEDYRDREPLTLREDFCGTALDCAEFVRRNPERTAVGIDLDPDVLAWGRERNIEPLGGDASRVTLLNQNVIKPPDQKFDIIVAMNFSYFIFKTRRELLAYFESVHQSLGEDGVFALDCYGGWEAYEVQDEKRELDDFYYIWDQAAYNPVTNEVTNHIHFRFFDGSTMNRAFSYDWRLWQLAELREILEDVGFSQVRFWWEIDDEDDNGTGEYEEKDDLENDPGWVCYLTASV